MSNNNDDGLASKTHGCQAQSSYSDSWWISLGCTCPVWFLYRLCGVWQHCTQDGCSYVRLVYKVSERGTNKSCSFNTRVHSVLETPVIGFHKWDLYLLFRLFLGGTLAVMTWEIVDRIFDVYFAVVSAYTDDFGSPVLFIDLVWQNEPITLPYENAHETLLAGLRLEQDPFLQVKHAQLSSFWREMTHMLM